MYTTLGEAAGAIDVLSNYQEILEDVALVFLRGQIVSDPGNEYMFLRSSAAKPSGLWAICSVLDLEKRQLVVLMFGAEVADVPAKPVDRLLSLAQLDA